MKNLKYTWFLLVLLALAACGQDVAPDMLKATDAAAPTITSDKADYAPGELVTLTGSNWQAGESVRIVVDDDGLQEKVWKRDVTVIADDAGTITDQFNLPDWFVADYVVNATGEMSGTAKTAFTDGNVAAETSGPSVTLHYKQFTGTSCSPNPGVSPSSPPTISGTSGSTILFGQNSGSFRLEVPTTAANGQVFSGWTAQSGFSSTDNPLCFNAISGNRTFRANYVAAVAVDTTTTLASSLNPSTSGQSATFTATVAAASGDNAPTGTVTFKNGTTNLGTGTLARVGTTKTATATYSTDALAVGSHSITAQYGGVTGFNTSTSAALTQQVNAACTAPSITTQPANVTATVGGAATFSVTAGGTGTLSYQWLKGGNNIQGATSASYDLTSVTTTDAGNYSVKVTNLCGSLTSNAATLTVNKADQTISFATGTPTTKTYGDADFTVSATATSGLDVSFAAKEGSTCSVSSSGTVSNLRVGDCIIVASQAGNSNYTAAPTVEHKIVVGKAAAEISLSNLSHTYDSSAKNVTVTTKPAGLSVTVTYDGSETAPTDAGSYAVVATVNDKNYEAFQTSNTLIITQADATIKVEGYEGTYDGEAHGATGTATGVNGESLPLNLGESFTNVPGGKANWSLAGDGNYKAASGSVDIKISKAKATVNVSGYEGTYDGEAHGATGTATGVNGVTLTLNLGDSFTNVPGGTANWSFDGDGNYEEAKGSVDIKINKAKATVNVSGYEGIYDGEAHGATGKATGVGGSDLSHLFDLGASFTDAGTYTANWSFAGDVNHEEENGSVDIKISKADATVDVKGYEGVYDGNPHGATGTATGVKGESLSLDLGDSFTNVPGGTANWSFAGDANYNAANGSVGIEISKATATVNVVGYTGTYDGNPHGATGTAMGVKGETLSGLSLGDSFTNVPGGTANWSLAESANHKGATGSVGIEISKATASVALSNLSYVFDGSAKSATVTTNPSGLRVATTYNGSSSAPSAVGSYSVVATIDETNYQGSASGTLTISAWTLKGFYAPVDMGGVVNTIKAGSTVPLKFEIFAASELTNTSAISSFKTATIQCSTLSTTSDEIEVTTTGGTSLRYDSTAGQFIQNWQTPKTVGVCYRATLTTQDGVGTITAYFKTR